MSNNQWEPITTADAVPARTGWQPIETAPKDGRTVLLYCPHGDGSPGSTFRVTCGEWIEDEGGITEHRDIDGRWIGQDESDGFTGWMSADGGFSEDTMMPTHWMPMPEPPAGSVESTAHVGEMDRTAPREVWLQIDTEGDSEDRSEAIPRESWSRISWHYESMGGQEVRYIRADLAGSVGATEGYYLVTFKQRARGGEILWWGPDNCGYTPDLKQAGIYTEITPGYHDSDVTVPVPVSFMSGRRVRSIVDPGDSDNAMFWSASQLRAALTAALRM